MAPADNRTGVVVPPEHAALTRLARLLLPNLAAMLAAATLLYCVFMFNADGQLFRDSDSGWHIRSGEWLLVHRALPRTDPYSFSKADEPWFEWEWGSDILVGWAHRIDGLRGVTALVALAISACSWMWCRLHFAAGGDFLLISALAPLMITTSSLHWLARPHIFSWLFLLGALLYAERFERRTASSKAESAQVRFSLTQLAVVAGVTAVWTNLHASFFLAPVIALIYAASHVLRPVVWPIDHRGEFAKARWFLWAALAAAAGSLLNPYGWRLHAHVISYLRDDELTSRIAEFQSFNFHDKDATQVALTVAVAAVGGTLALGQKKLAHFLLAGMFLWEGLRSARVLPLVALLILPLANGTIAEALSNARHLRLPLGRAVDRALEYSARLRVLDNGLHGVLFLATVVFASLLVLRTPAFSRNIGFPAAQFPVEAAVVVEKLPADARLLAPDSFGGYLIYRFNGSRKVFVDGRSDFYGAPFMKQYLALMSARPGWQDILRSYRFTHALLPNDSALTGALEQAGWVPLHHDNVATLLEWHPAPNPRRDQ